MSKDENKAEKAKPEKKEKASKAKPKKSEGEATAFNKVPGKYLKFNSFEKGEN